MSDPAPATPVPQVDWSAAAPVPPLKRRTLFIHVEKGSCFPATGLKPPRITLQNSQPSHRWCEYWGEFSIKNVDAENMEQTGKKHGEKKGQSRAKSQTWGWANTSNRLLMLTTAVCAPINILINLEKCYYLTEGSSFPSRLITGNWALVGLSKLKAWFPIHYVPTFHAERLNCLLQANSLPAHPESSALLQ